MSTRICNICRKELSLDSFAFKDKKKGSYQYHCRACNKIKCDEYYQNNKDKIISRSVKASKQKRDCFQTWKASLKCQVCDESATPCLDFHHVDDSEKSFEICNHFAQYTPSDITREVNKCAVVCSNCHRKHHAGLLTVSLTKLTVDHDRIWNNLKHF